MNTYFIETIIGSKIFIWVSYLVGPGLKLTSSELNPFSRQMKFLLNIHGLNHRLTTLVTPFLADLISYL